MTVIKVPKPPKSAFNRNRPVSALLKNQILHMQEVEFRFPARDQTNIYINKIKTEGEAAEYLRQVTARLHPEGTSQMAFENAAGGKRKPARKTRNKVKSKSKTRSKIKTPPKRKRTKS